MAVRVLAGCVLFTVGCVLATIAATLSAGEAVAIVAAGEVLPAGAPFAHPVATPVMSRRPTAPPAMPAAFQLPGPPRGRRRLELVDTQKGPSRIPMRITIPYPLSLLHLRRTGQSGGLLTDRQRTLQKSNVMVLGWAGGSRDGLT